MCFKGAAGPRLKSICTRQEQKCLCAPSNDGNIINDKTVYTPTHPLLKHYIKPALSA